jgi:hypothetical protein
MAEMKSAFERAWERAQGLGKLLPEEVRRRKEEEFAPAGRGLAQQFLEHGYTDIFTEGVHKYSDEEGEIVTKAALSRLVEAIELGDGAIAARAMEGIIALKGNGALGEINERMKGIFQEYGQERWEKQQRKREQIERERKEILHRLRISGDAVGEVNLDSSEAWERISEGLRSPFEDRLHQLKQELWSLFLTPGSFPDEGDKATRT